MLGVLGEEQEGLQKLRESAVDGFPRAEWLRTQPLFDDLRAEPRFSKILDRVGGNQREIQEKLRRMNLDLYPPGAEPDRSFFSVP